MKRQSCITKSGVSGWQQSLRDLYEGIETFRAYSEIYSLTERLGYKSVESAWRKNPILQGSTNPNDLRSVNLKQAKKSHSQWLKKEKEFDLRYESLTCV